jgi:ABC-type nickel/cobalt efflux system permease component RcnA
MRLRFILLLLAVFALAAARGVAAHPLGNFSISQYSGLRVDKNEIELRYLVDMAEIPTFQEIQETGIAPEIGEASVEKYVARKADTLRENLWLEVNGRRIALQAESSEIIFPPGAGGLPTMKIGVVYKGTLNASASGLNHHRLYYRDGNFPGRAGWKEIIAVPGNKARLLDSSVPEIDRSSQLSDYPNDLLNSPPQVLEARITFSVKENPVPAAVAVTIPVHPLRSQRKDEIGQVPLDKPVRTFAKPVAEPKVKSPDLARLKPENDRKETATVIGPIQLQANKQATPTNSFTDLIVMRHLDWSMLLFAFLIAAALGAFHALEPGHGKTLVAAYLVGSRGTMRHALTLGLIVTAAHTVGVYLIGGVTLYASRYVVPEQLYPWLALLSGVMITCLGLVLFFRRYWNNQTVSDVHHVRQHSHHSSDSDPGYSHPHAGLSHHDHQLTGEVSLRQLLALGISGGIVPCPAALVVLLSAVAMNRVRIGLLLVVAFSVGLAVVLIGIGLLTVYARQFMSRFHGDGRLTTRWLPLTSSVFITIFGIALTWQSVQTTGLIALRL